MSQLLGPAGGMEHRRFGTAAWHARCFAVPVAALCRPSHRGDSPRYKLIAKERVVINLIVWLVVGGLIGWIASMIMRTDAQQGIGLNIIVGIVGALIAGFVVSPLLGFPTINEGAFSAGSLVVSLIGAIILLAIVNLFRRGRVR